MKSKLGFYNKEYFQVCSKPTLVVSKKALLASLMLLGSLLTWFYHFPVKTVYSAYPNYQMKDLVVTPVMDTYIAEGQANRDFANEQLLRVGYDTNGSTGRRARQRSFLTFNLAYLARQSTINSATLSLWLAGGEAFTALTVQTQRSTMPLPSPLTWDSYNASSPGLADPVTLSVGSNLTEYRWDLKALLQNWSNNQPSDNLLMLVVSGGENASSDHERFFWSADCTDAECSGKKPSLLIRFEEPTPVPTFTSTATSTPTNTPIPTPTSTPTPGIKAIRLQNVPQEELAGGAMVTYTIDLENGPFDLAKVVVRNPLPDEMEFVSESASAPSGWAFSLTERTVKWTLPTLVAGATARLVYRAERHTPTSTPTPTLIETQPETPTATPTPTSTRSAVTPTLTQTALPQTLTPTATLPALATSITITKTGPSVVAGGAEIRYQLTVANHITRTFTGLTIVDLIPVGAEVVDFGGGAMTMPPSAMLQWQVPRLNGQSVVTRTFAIRPFSNQSQVVNELYFVDVIENGVLQLRVVGKAAVVTTIVGGGLEPLSVLLALPAAPLTATTPIINNGAVVTWEYPNFNSQLGSNGVRNPMHRLYLPFIPR